MIVTFGEIMARLAPTGFQRLRQAVPGPLNLTFAGAEANVAASVAILGGRSRFVTALPGHALADACVDRLRGLGIDTSCILRTAEGRLGVYFLETGANQRPSHVLYDREGTSLSLTAASQYPWREAFRGAAWFHVSGVTPALSPQAAEATLAAVRAAKEAGATVSFDLNFRKKLWRWDRTKSPRELAGATLAGILPFVDVLIGNEEDYADVLGIGAGAANVHAGRLDAEAYGGVALEAAARFPNLRRLAVTLRESLSASHNNWGAMLHTYEDGRSHFAPQASGRYAPYEIRNLVDRLGAGDAFSGALIFALTTPGMDSPPKALAFATAASCLAQSIPGDFNYSTRAEIESLMNGSASGRVIR